MIYKKIGGEIEYKAADNYKYLTDTGRSSLRIILQRLNKKKFLIPDFLCKTIVDIFKEKKIKFEYYSVNESFNVRIDSNKKFDVLYLINFFGKKFPKFKKFEKKIIIEDNVFLPYFNNDNNYKKWIGFNSFRKVTPMVDGSLIRSTFKLDAKLILKKESKFVYYKTKGLNLKYEYNKFKFSNDRKYLSLIKRGENILDKQKKSFMISNQSILQYNNFGINFEKEKKKRKENFNFLKKKLYKYSIKINPEFHSFFPILVQNKTKIIKELSKHKIYLPNYYPKFDDLKNNLFDKLLCVPIDSRYEKKDMSRVSSILLKII